MKEILVILAQTEEGISKNDIVYSIEKENWIVKTRQAKNGEKKRVPTDSVRVSYFRTLSKLDEMHLIDEFHYDYIVTDYYRLTQEGKIVAQKIIDRVLEDSERLNQLILNGASFYDPSWRVLKK
jgi:hypothetical protein